MSGMLRCTALSTLKKRGLWKFLMIGIKNPISAARVVLEHSEKKDGIGRIPPLSVLPPFVEVKSIVLIFKSDTEP